MTLERFARSCLVTFFLTLLSTRFAQAGAAHLDCRAPFVFQGAAVNVVVLPYEYAGNGFDTSLANLGNRLSLLVKLDILSHILDYGSVGAVQMEMPEGMGSNDQCRPENVLPILLGVRSPNPGLSGPVSGSQNSLRPGNGLVLVWGMIYVDGEDVFVQTYARFLRRDVDEAIPFQAGGFSFFAKPSSESLAFTPQKFSRGELEQVEDSYREADYVRDSPNDGASGEQLPKLVAKCAGPYCDDTAIHAGYYVTEKRGEWIHIQYIDPIQNQRKEGWIHSAGGLAGKPLDQILPELKFLEGCAGYLSLRVADAKRQALPPGAQALAIHQLDSFVESNVSQPEDINNAMALELGGAVAYLGGRDQPVALSQAADQFERARKIIPYDPNAISLAVVTQMALEWRQQGRCEHTVEKAQQLSTALAFHSDKNALANLTNFYALLERSPESAPSPDNLDKGGVALRAAALRSVALRQ